MNYFRHEFDAHLIAHRSITRFTNPTKTKSDCDLVQHETSIKIQNEKYYDIYDQLVKFCVSDQDQIKILRANLQFIPESKSQVSKGSLLVDSVFLVLNSGNDFSVLGMEERERKSHSGLLSLSHGGCKAH